MVRSIPQLAATLFLAVASLPALAQPDLAYAPQGPGAVFDSIEAAAVDGLAWAHRLRSEPRGWHLARGGTIVAVDSGFTYGPLVIASPREPDVLRMSLGPDAVAHFHTYPQRSHPLRGRRSDRENEQHSRKDRWVVDHLDPQGRPSFVLTPSLRIVAYHGRAANLTSDLFVASLDTLGNELMLASQ